MKLKTKIILFAVSLLTILGLLFLNAGVANPDSQNFYNLKRLIEKTELSIKTTPRGKLDFLFQLQEKRLAELRYIVIKGESPHVLKASLRFFTTTGQITELIIENGFKDEAQKAKEKFESQLPIISDLIQNYPKDDGEVKFVVDDRNYLIIYIDQLSSLL